METLAFIGMVLGSGINFLHKNINKYGIISKYKGIELGFEV